ncbi:MAG: HAD family hydrolase [Thermodesulfobacteriota bacterium]
MPQFPPLRAAVFLDRDGTVNEQMGYINHISRFHLFPEAGPAIRLLNERGVPAVLVTNQSGLARGYFPESLLDRVHRLMEEELARQGARFDGIYVCPHHPEAREERFRVDCDCRKPKPGLLLRAAAELGLDLGRSYMIGDRLSDIRAAAGVGSCGVMVLTGYGRGDMEYLAPARQIQPAHVAEDLFAAVRWVLADLDARTAGRRP